MKSPIPFALSLVLYATALVTSNAVSAAPISEAERQAIKDARAGDMRKLAIHKTPEAAGTADFERADGTKTSLAAFKGKTIVLNFWATWCAPCRHEMPTLNALQKQMKSDDFEVLVVATGRNRLPQIQKFFKDVNVDALEIYLDPKSALAREMAVLGLPITVVLDREGGEIARLRGDADWASSEAIATLKQIIEAQAN